MREGLYIHIDDVTDTIEKWALGLEDEVTTRTILDSGIREKLVERSALYVTPEGTMIRRKP